MAAKIYSTPLVIGEPPQLGHFLGDGGGAIQDYLKAEEKWVESVKDWVRRNCPGELAGEEVRFPAGDGSARYIVKSLKPLGLIHLPVGDGWHCQFAHLLTAAEIRKMVSGDKKVRALFGRKV